MNRPPLRSVSNNGNKPTTTETGRLIAYTVRDYESGGEQKAWWTAIGTARKNKDDSLTVYLDALPLDGKIIIRKETPKEKGHA